MRLTKDLIADEFIAAAAAVGLKKVMVLVGAVDADIFVVTMTVANPVARGLDDQFLVTSSPYEFDDADHVKELARAKAWLFVRTIPTIH